MWVQHRLLEPVAVDFAERRAKAGQDGVCLWIVGRCLPRSLYYTASGGERAGDLIGRGWHIFCSSLSTV
jgi:hypothetical protein